MDDDYEDEDAEYLRLAKSSAELADDAFRDADEALSKGRPNAAAAQAALAQGIEHVDAALDLFPEDDEMRARRAADRVYAKQALDAIGDGRIAAAAALVCRLCYPGRAKTHAAPLMVMPDEIAAR